MKIKLSMPPEEECFTPEYFKNLESVYKDKKKTILAMFESGTFESLSNKNLMTHILLNTLANNKNAELHDESFSLYLNWIENKEHLLDILKWYSDVIPLRLIFEKLVPYIEHFPDKSKALLLKLSKTRLDETVLFVANLSIAQYKYADDLLDWLEESLIKDTGESKFQLIHEVFTKNRSDIDEIQNNRMLLFPKIVD